MYEKIKSELTFDMYHNGIIRRPFSRAKLTAYRGESEEGGSGMAYLGQGIYSATKKSYAAKYGTVRTVSVEELPFNPFRFRSFMYVDQFEHDMRKKYGTEYYNDTLGGLEGILKSWGYDGATVGTVDDMVIVKYPSIT